VSNSDPSVNSGEMREALKKRVRKKIPSAPQDTANGDEKATAEASALASGVDLSSREQVNKFNRLLRDDGVDGHLNKIVVCGVWIVALAALAMFLAVVAHKLKPGFWLDDDQISDLQSFLFSGGIGAALASGGKRIFKNEKSA
jgi:hypothetical protein